MFCSENHCFERQSQDLRLSDMILYFKPDFGFTSKDLPGFETEEAPKGGTYAHMDRLSLSSMGLCALQGRYPPKNTVAKTLDGQWYPIPLGECMGE